MSEDLPKGSQRADPGTPQPEISVLICVLNGADVIGRQLSALAAQSVSVPWEIVVADNGSTDGTRAVLESLAPSLPVALTVVDASAQRGVGFARNVAAQAAQSPLLAYCDADDRVAPGWVQAALEAGRAFPVATGLTRLLTEPQDPDAPVVNPGLLSGRVTFQEGNCVIRRDVFFGVGGYDASLPRYGNEGGELVERLRRVGYAVAAAPEMVIYFQPTVGWRPRLRKVYSAGLAEVVVWHRHRDAFASNLSGGRLLMGALTAPASAAREVIRDRRVIPERIARRVVLRWAHLIGYLTLVRTGRIGPPSRVSDPRAQS